MGPLVVFVKVKIAHLLAGKSGRFMIWWMYSTIAMWYGALEMTRENGHRSLECADIPKPVPQKVFPGPTTEGLFRMVLEPVHTGEKLIARTTQTGPSALPIERHLLTSLLNWLRITSMNGNRPLHSGLSHAYGSRSCSNIQAE